MLSRSGFAFFVLSVWSAGSFAQPEAYGPTLDYGIGLRVEYNDNVALQPGSQVEDTLLAPFIDFGIDRQGTRIDVEASGIVEHASYVDSTFDSEFRGNISASMNYRVVDGRLNWVAQNGLTRSALNVLGVQTPDNVQQTNSFTTGPDLTFRLGSADDLLLGARYNNFLADQDDNAVDYDGYSIFGQWNRLLSPTTTIGLRLQNDSVGFDQIDLTQPDYDRSVVSAIYTRDLGVGSGMASSLSVDVGYAQADFDGIESIDSPYFRLEWTRQLAGGQEFGLRLTREIGDTFSDTLGFGNSLIARPVQETAVVRDPFTRSLAGATWSRPVGQNYRFNLSATYDEQDYSVSELDQELLSFDVGFEWQIAPLLSMTSNLGWTDQEFTDIGQQSDRFDASVGVSYQRTRNLFLLFGVRYSDESNTIPALTFDTFVASVQVTYRR